MARRTAKAARRGAGYGAMTPRRASRIYKLVKLLAKAEVGRGTLLSRLRVGVRTFYRDVNCLRASGVTLKVWREKYTIDDDLPHVLEKLSFPDARLSFSEAMELAKGRGPGARKVRALLRKVTGV